MQVSDIAGRECFWNRNKISERLRTRQCAFTHEVGIRNELSFADKKVTLFASYKSAHDLARNVVRPNAKEPDSARAQSALALKQMIKRGLGTFE